MSIIPEDVRQAALDAWLSVPTAEWEENAVEAIAKAILAERTRCATIARANKPWGNMTDSVVAEAQERIAKEIEGSGRAL